MTDDVSGPAGVAAPAEEFLDVPGGRVHMYRAGTGEPLLFLHAAGGLGREMEFHARLGRRFDVIAPDHPGFGKSDDFPEFDTVGDLVYHYLDVLDALGLDRVHLVGASLGGWIAAELAVAASHRLRSLVLLSPAGLRLPDHPVADIFMMTPAELVATLFETPPPPPPPPGIDAILAIARNNAAAARFSWAPYMSNPKLERRLHRITVPTLVAASPADRLIPVAHARRYAERIAGARYAEVTGCGHAMPAEKPAEVAGLITDFIAGLASTAGLAAAAGKGAGQ